MQFLYAFDSWLPWVALAAVPAAIIALYFLKLRRRPLEVPSTFLWRKSIEDLHVNAPLQRLRRNLLLFLQLLIVGLAIFALLRPSHRARETEGRRYVLLVDNSASMSASDIQPSRVEEAKKQARAIIDSMTDRDLAMLVSFSDTAQVLVSYTNNRNLLRQRLDAIQPTHHSTSLRDALQVASGLANPERAVDRPAGSETESLEADVYIFTDGGFDDVKDFSLGNLQPHLVSIGTAAANAGIVGLSVRRGEEQPDQLQVFSRVQNFGPEQLPVDLELWLDGRRIDARRLTLEAGKAGAATLDLVDVTEGVLELRVLPGDAFPLDNRAWAVVNRQRRAQVLVVTPGNGPLQTALGTEATQQMAEIQIEGPEYLKTEAYAADAQSGKRDLIIYDRVAPSAMPQANTFSIGVIPPVAGLGPPQTVERPIILHWDMAHPLLRYVQLDNVEVLSEAQTLKPPPGSTVLVESPDGPLLFITPREAYQDAVLTFPLVTAGAGETRWATTWPLRPSFPLFVFNALQFLAYGDTAPADEVNLPGRPVTLRLDAPVREIRVRPPDGQDVALQRSAAGAFVFTATDQTGVYDVTARDSVPLRFAVNLFDPRESDLTVRRDIQIGYEEVKGQTAERLARREFWKPLLLLALSVLLVEWYIYNRRVFL